MMTLRWCTFLLPQGRMFQSFCTRYAGFVRYECILFVFIDFSLLRFFFASRERAWFEFFLKIRFKIICPMCWFFFPFIYLHMSKCAVEIFSIDMMKITNRSNNNVTTNAVTESQIKNVYLIVWLWNVFVCVMRVYFFAFPLHAWHLYWQKVEKMYKLEFQR